MSGNLIRVVSCKFVDRVAFVAARTALWIFFILYMSVFTFSLSKSGTEIPTSRKMTFDETKKIRSTKSHELSRNDLTVQGSELDYSKFLHTSQRHSSIACADCHERTQDNSPTPRFPGHKACSNCHLSQFVTPAIPMCLICHTDTRSSNPPLKTFPARFNESFNVKFDHAQHMTASARPQNGCSGCHNRPLSRGSALSIPAKLAAHTQCYACHTPTSKTQAGREMASCGVCHEQKRYSRTSTNSRSFRYGFSHTSHGPRQGLQCSTCHNLTPGAPQTRQVSSPSASEHFPTARGMSCASCHNGRRSFGGDLDFKTCRRCHNAPTFRMPL